jgi:hypothetical protein
MSESQRMVGFPLVSRGHFRVSARFLLASLILGALTWWLDIRASRQPFDRGALLGAVLAGVCLGIVVALALITWWRACWCYRATGAGSGRRLALSFDQEGVSLHLLGCALSWTEIGWARIEDRPGHRGSLLVLGVAESGFVPVSLRVRLILEDRLAFGTRGAALKAWSAHHTPFVVDLRTVAAAPGAVEHAVRAFAPGLLPAEGSGPGRQPVRHAVRQLAAFRRHLQTGQEPPGGSRLRDHSWFAWAFLLFVGALLIGLGSWAQTKPFQDAWLLQHGQPATATVVRIITPCNASRQLPQWEVSYLGRSGEPEYASTTNLWACPAVGAQVPIVFDPGNPGYVGDVRVLRNRPFKLLLGAALVTGMLLFLNMAVGFWRERG